MFKFGTGSAVETCCESSQNLLTVWMSVAANTLASCRITVSRFLGNLFRSAVVPMVTGHLWFEDTSEGNGVGHSKFPW